MAQRSRQWSGVWFDRSHQVGHLAEIAASCKKSRVINGIWWLTNGEYMTFRGIVTDEYAHWLPSNASAVQNEI